MGTHYMLALSQQRWHTKTVTSDGDSSTKTRVAAAEELKQAIHLAADCVRNLLIKQNTTQTWRLRGLASSLDLLQDALHMPSVL